jgi:hypothetical protein
MFKFTIRELVLLTLVAAMGLGWFVHWRAMEAGQRKVGKELEVEVVKNGQLIVQLQDRTGLVVGWEGPQLRLQSDQTTSERLRSQRRHAESRW